MKDISNGIKRDSTCAVIVAHPDDETLWCGGLMLMHPQAQWTVITLCRRDDTDRFRKFHKVMKKFGATGIMGDLDDGPEQIPLDWHEVRCAISELLPSDNFDFIITHSPYGEYTRHRRHEEVGRAVAYMWENEELLSKELWQFAYEDSNRQHSPRPIQSADLIIELPKEIWQIKYDIITTVYGFAPHGFEANAATKKEAFWCFNTKTKLNDRNNND